MTTQLNNTLKMAKCLSQKYYPNDFSALSDAYLAVAESLNSYKSECGNLSSYSYRKIIWNLMQYGRNLKRNSYIPIDELEIEIEEKDPLERGVTEYIQELVSDLNEIDYKIVVNLFYENKTIKQTAEEIGFASLFSVMYRRDSILKDFKRKLLKEFPS